MMNIGMLLFVFNRSDSQEGKNELLWVKLVNYLSEGFYC